MGLSADGELGSTGADLQMLVICRRLHQIVGETYSRQVSDVLRGVGIRDGSNVCAVAVGGRGGADESSGGSDGETHFDC